MAPAAEAFLPARSTVVLLIGLPGDLETETSYRQQARAWLEWLGGAEQPPRRIFLLQDDPERGAAKVPCPIEHGTASRADFLGLTNRLRDETNSVVLIALGHGGQQGKTPVFHVRGPRITEADLKGWAGQLTCASSRWILYFRGSGSFARGLAAERRQIISSDGTTSFGSDPIGLALLLKGLQENRSRSFVSAAEELGRGTGVWYEERRLVRTEDPTLWLPGQAPRALALTGTVGALTQASPTPGTAATTSTNALQAEAEPASLPVAWQNIRRVNPEQFPEADLVVLKRRLEFTLAGKPAVSSEHEEFIQVLTAAGKEAGDFDLTYSPPQEELTLLDCEVLLPEGRVIRLGADEVRESGEAPVADYPGSRRKFFSLPGIAPGAVLRVRYRKEWQTYPMPQAWLSLPLADAMPVLSATFQISVPKDSAFHFFFHRFPVAEPTLKQSAHGSSYSWVLTNLAVLSRESLLPPDFQPALIVSTWPDWTAFAEWYSRLSKRADDLTPALEEKAREITRASRSDRGKVIALYDYVTSLRYVMVPLGVNSLRPHAADRVLRNRFGDCKDKANLFNALLHALGFEACLVLVPRFSQAHPEAPGLGFNHAISRVRLGEETIWADTTDEVCRFGMLPPGNAGRHVLLVDGKSTSLTELPRPASQDHRFHLRARLDWNAPEEAGEVSIQARAAGFPDYQLRLAATGGKARGSPTPLLMGLWRLSSGAFSLAKQNFTPASKLDQDFAWQAEGLCVGLVSAVEGKTLLRAPFWLPSEWNLALHPRSAPLCLHQGYPLTLDEEIEITLPAGSKSIALPATRENPSEPLTWKLEWTKTSDQAVRAALRLELARADLSAVEASLVQKQLRRLLTALGDGVTFEPAR